LSYNGSGTFNINTAGQPVVTGTVISSTAFNALTADLATGLSTAITKDGQTTTTARIVFAQGVSSTLTTDATSATTGSIITAGGISMQKALWVGTTSRHVGAATFDAAITYGGVTLSNAVTGTGNMVLSASPTLTGTLTAAAANFSGIVKSTGGTGGGTAACFVADAANSAYGWKTSGAGSNANIWDSIVTSASSTLAFRMVNDAVTDATNWLSVTRTGYTSAVVTLPQPINYGGVTLSNSVTGTGSMVLSASPTLTGTLTAATANFSGAVTQSINNMSRLSVISTNNGSEAAFVFTGKDSGGAANSFKLGLGITADSEATLYDVTNSAIVFRYLRGGAFTFTPGLVLGAPTGGNKGAGTANFAGDIYKNNTAYTNPDYVLEHWATGQIVKFADKEGAAEYDGLKPLSEVKAFAKENLHLPRFGQAAGHGLFSGSDAVLASLEEAYLYIFQLEARISALEENN